MRLKRVTIQWLKERGYYEIYKEEEERQDEKGINNLKLGTLITNISFSQSAQGYDFWIKINDEYNSQFRY